MKIAFVLRRFPVVSQTFVVNQITGLLERGHDVEILAEAPSGEPNHPDVERSGLLTRITYWPSVPQQGALRWIKGAGLLAQLAARRPRAAATALNVAAYGRLALTMNLAYAARPLRTPRRFDIIHCHFGENGNLGLALRDMGLITGKLVTAYHGFDLSLDLERYGNRVYARLFRDGDLHLPISERWSNTLRTLGCHAERIVVHRMGIDPRRFAMRTRTPDPTGATRLVSVCRLIEKKGIEYAIRAVALLATQGHQIVYTIVGSGPLSTELETLANALGVGRVVRFVGDQRQPDVIRALDAAQIFLAPSVVAANGDEEGIPVVLMEAMAIGLPVVATRHSAIPELVEDGVSGRLVPERDVPALATAIQDCMKQPDRWAAWGAAGRARVVERHDVEALNDLLVQRFQRLLD